MATAKKEEAVAALRKRLEDAQSVVLADFTGLDVEGMTALRSEFRKNESSFFVVKNTLGRIAIRERKLAGLDRFLEAGPTGWAVTSADPTSPARVLMEFAKTHGRPVVKGGFFDGAFLTAEDVGRVANLPPKPVLVAQILGLLQAPVQGVAGTLHAVMTSLAVAADEIRKQKEAGGGAS